jgi:hypothetical protein
MPISTDRTGDEDGDRGDGRLLFAFCFFAAAICRFCGVRSFDLTRTLPVGLFRSLDEPSHAAAAKCLRQTVN